MFRIRFHGRGGQGIKTSSRMLGTALFIAGYEVQDAPRYGAERRGAPIFAYVRAAASAIHERGVIPNPDLVLVADDTLIGVPAAGILQGLDDHTVLAIISNETTTTWQQRLASEARIVILPGISTAESVEHPYLGAMLAGAAARLLGLNEESIIAAIGRELDGLGEAITNDNVDKALLMYRALADSEGIVNERDEGDQPADPDWIELRREDVDRSAPAIHATATSVQIKTGLWRTLRPIVDMTLCKRCTWVCGSFCPDSAIAANADGFPMIDYDHCKGCMICLAQCPSHAIHAEAEKGVAS